LFPLTFNVTWELFKLFIERIRENYSFQLGRFRRRVNYLILMSLIIIPDTCYIYHCLFRAERFYLEISIYQSFFPSLFTVSWRLRVIPRFEMKTRLNVASWKSRCRMKHPFTFNEILIQLEISIFSPYLPLHSAFTFRN